MRQTVVGLLVLLTSLGVMALAPASLELARLSPDQSRAGEPPELPDWRALARAPAPARPTGRPQVALQAAKPLPEFRHFSDAEFVAWIARRQGRAAAEALVLRRGSLELAELARRLADPAVLEQKDDAFTLRRPLVIRRGAALVLPEGSVLRLSTKDAAFLVNGGQLILRGAEVTSWDARRGAPSELERDRRFRPFVAATGGSWTEIVDSTLSHLGYDAAKSYGLSLVSGSSSLAAAGPPRGRITGSRIVGNYYGLYSYEADGLVIAANAFVDNVVYGIDPHDRSRRLVIADNTVTGTRRKHGIVVSRGVSESWIIGNGAVGNAGTGIVIDAASTDIVVADNLAGANRGDGLSLFESGRNLMWGNLAIANRKSGLRIRNGWAIEVHRNAFIGNGYDGVEAYAEELEPPLDNQWRAEAELRLSLSLVGNRFAGNARSAINVRRPGRVELFGSHGPGAEPLRLGGDLQPHAAEIQAQLERTGGIRITGGANAPDPS
jgi:poly(beta-D-mannuronate) C5 epimerase